MQDVPMLPSANNDGVDVAMLRSVQVLKVSLINSFIMKMQKAKLHEHRASLKHMINAGQAMLASHQDCGLPLVFPQLKTDSRRTRRREPLPEVSL